MFLIYSVFLCVGLIIAGAWCCVCASSSSSSSSSFTSLSSTSSSSSSSTSSSISATANCSHCLESIAPYYVSLTISGVVNEYSDCCDELNLTIILERDTASDGYNLNVPGGNTDWCLWTYLLPYTNPTLCGCKQLVGPDLIQTRGPYYNFYVGLRKTGTGYDVFAQVRQIEGGGDIQTAVYTDSIVTPSGIKVNCCDLLRGITIPYFNQIDISRCIFTIPGSYPCDYSGSQADIDVIGC